MRILAPILLCSIACALLACTTESNPDDRPDRPQGDGGVSITQGDGAPDPGGGRDTRPASCYASCQNTSFTCQAAGSTATITAELALAGPGCIGSSKTDDAIITMKIDCDASQVCVGANATSPATSCVPGTFSAFSFAYSPPGGSSTICTRD